MNEIAAYAAFDDKSSLGPWKLKRRDLKPHDVKIRIDYCGVCHSDIHQVRNEWGEGHFPMVPGHEIVGEVIAVGDQASKYKLGDRVGVGCFVDSCRRCPECEAGLEQYCREGMTGTYADFERDTREPTYGGYSREIVVDENYVLRVPDSIPLDRAAPLLCAGITTYSPLRHYGLRPGQKLAVVGLGGLGHMAVKLAVAMGAEVTVLSTSESKRDNALTLGAHHFSVTKDKQTFKELANHFDMIIDTISAQHDYNAYLSLLKVDGKMILLGIPEIPAPVAAAALIMKRRVLAGSVIGGIAETQEMLDFCAKHDIAADIELIDAKEINTAYERMLKGDVLYRFVIDCSTLEK